MSRILKRPMFRIGGSTNDGIVSMAQPRKNYQEGSDYQKRIDELRPLFQAAAGQGRSRDDRLSDLLISGGLNLMSARPSGNIFSTAASAFKEPTSQYLKAKETEDAFQRQINLAAATQGISSVEAERLQRMKLQAALAEDQQKLEIDKRKLAATTDAGSYPIYDVLENFRKKGFNPQKITQMVGTGETIKPAPRAVLSIPEGEIFYDSNNNLYKRVSKEISDVGYVRIDRAGKEIKAEAKAKKTGFFDTPGAAYDPRSWNKQKFYESLAKKNPPSTME
jgi:hypothetical protein